MNTDLGSVPGVHGSVAHMDRLAPVSSLLARAEPIAFGRSRAHWRVALYSRGGAALLFCQCDYLITGVLSIIDDCCMSECLI